MSKQNNKTTLICPHTKRFESIFVCAINCQKKCTEYLENIDISVLEEFVTQHPEYEIKGEIMAIAKDTKTTSKKKVKHYWIIDEENKIEEVTEEDILQNPQSYLDKHIWDKPPNQYEIVITLKRKR